MTTALHAGAREKHSETIWTLTVIHAPLQLVTLCVIYAFSLGNLTSSLTFIALYLFTSTLLVRLLCFAGPDNRL
jgi:hypothetical protein